MIGDLVVTERDVHRLFAWNSLRDSSKSTSWFTGYLFILNTKYVNIDVGCKMSRKKRVMKEELKSGKILLGMGVESENTDFVEIAAMVGFDFIYLDQEHTTTSWETLKRLVIAADLYDTPVIVRVEKNDEVAIRKALEMGVQGILVPHVCTKEETIKAIQAAKFPPKGVRGAASNVRSAGFGARDWKNYVPEANSDVLVSIMFEDKKAMENVDEILSVDGLDAVCYGPVDYAFSKGLGEKGEFRGHPLIEKDFDILIKKCKKRGIYIQYTPVPQDYVTVKEAIDRGVSFLFIGSDIVAFIQQCKNLMDNVYNKVKE